MIKWTNLQFVLLFHYNHRLTMTTKRYPIPAGAKRTELEILNSRFIASLSPVFTVEAAKAFLTAIRAEFPDATHHVPAYLVGHGSALIAHSSDDGEPAGTAGRPVLTVLQGSGLGDVAVVVTRYFGGTKLGTGGLVRAYSEATKAVLTDLPRAEKVPTHTLMVAIPYSLFERVRLLLLAHRGQILDENFAADITLTAQLLADHFSPFQAALLELSKGTVTVEIVESNPATIMPL